MTNIAQESSKNIGPKSSDSETSENVPTCRQLILLPGDSLANLTVSPGSEEAQKTTATYGRNFAELLPSSDPATSLLRTFLGSSPPISTRCYLIWKVKATPARRSIYQLWPSMPRTDENASSLWPTASAQAAGEGPLLDKATDKDGKKPKQNERVYNPETGKHIQVSLNRAVKLFRTPNQRDWKGMSAKSWREREKGDKTPTLPDQIGGQLNPMWVEWLMGFPLGWTDLEDSETP